MEFKTEKNFVPYGECVTICKICQVILGGNSGISSKQYVVCDKCKNKSMKINQLKVGDKIKYTTGSSTYEGYFREATEDKVKVLPLGEYYPLYIWIRKDQVIAKLEPAPDKEIPIEFPARPFEFVFLLTGTELINSIDNPHQIFIMEGCSLSEDIRYVNNLRLPMIPHRPESLLLGKQYKVTIEEIP